MRMNGSVINVTINGAPINCMHFWTLKSIDNAPSSFKGPHIVLIVMRHDNITLSINTYGKFICVKLSLDRMAAVGGCNSHTSNVR